MLSTEVQRSVRLKQKKSPQIFPRIPMKPSNVWHGHSTRRSLPAGTARKVNGSLLRGRKNRLILQPKKNRKFSMGNSLLYLSCVDFCRVRPGGRTLLLFWGALKQACCLRFAKFSNIISVYYSFKRCSKIDSLVAI